MCTVPLELPQELDIMRPCQGANISSSTRNAFVETNVRNHLLASHSLRCVSHAAVTLLCQCHPARL